MSVSTIEMSKKKDTVIKYIIFFTLYKLLLEYTYRVAVSYWYAYLGFVYSPNISKCIISCIFFYGILFLLPRNLSVNGILLNTFFTVSIVPFLSFYWLADKETISMLYVVLFFLVFNTISRLPVKPLNLSLGKSFLNYEYLISAVFVMYVVASIYLGIIRGGIDYRALSFSTIYSLRDEGNTINVFGGYVLNWCAKSFFPLFTTYYLYKKSYFKVAVCFCCQLYLYLCYGFKAYLFAAVLTVFIYFWGYRASLNNEESNIGNSWVFIIGLIPCLFSRFSGLLGAVGFTANNTFAMRMLFEPARIGNGYFEYFSMNNKLYFSEGLIGKLFGLNYPYDRAIGFIITNYLNGPDAVSNSNTGIVADSYSQLGVLGIFVIAILAGLIVILIKKISFHLPLYFLGAAFFYPIFMLNDNPLLTNLLTNGWAVDIILLILFSGAVRVQKQYKFGGSAPVRR